MATDFSLLRAQLIKKGGKLGKGDTAEEMGWLVADVIGSFDDTLGTVLELSKFLREVYGLTDEEEGLIQNPSFNENGHSGPSPKTRDYMRSRTFKKLGGSAVSLAGGLASGATYVDAGSLARHTSAAATSGAHMIGVRAVAAPFKRSETITAWVDAIIKAKAAKLATRGAGIAAAAIPIPMASLGIGIGRTVWEMGVKVTLGSLITRTAMEIHWRANQEVIIGRSTEKPVGPASAIFYEIFTKRSITRIFGTYDTNKLIREPAGWMALNDKLMLM